MNVSLSAIRRHGLVAVGYGHDDDGHEIAFAIDDRMVAALEEAIAADVEVLVYIEVWQVLWPAIPREYVAIHHV